MTYDYFSFLVCNEELPISDSHGLMVFKELLNFIDSFTVIMFSVEIVLKWIDNFRTFWSNPWNVFDLFVTVLVRAVYPPPYLPLSLDPSFPQLSFVCIPLDSPSSTRVWYQDYYQVLFGLCLGLNGGSSFSGLGLPSGEGGGGLVSVSKL